MVITFFDKKGNIFRQIEGQGDEVALLKSQIGKLHKVKTNKERHVKDKYIKSKDSIEIEVGKTYSIDIETSKGKIELPKPKDDSFLIKVTNYIKDKIIEFEHVTGDN